MYHGHGPSEIDLAHHLVCSIFADMHGAWSSHGITAFRLRMMGKEWTEGTINLVLSTACVLLAAALMAAAAKLKLL